MITKMEAVPHVIAAQEVKSFLLAGNATLTFQSSASGHHLTYKVVKDTDRDLWLVKVLTRPDNESGYTFLGTLYISNKNIVTYKHSVKSQIHETSQSVVVFKWVIDRLDKPEVLEKMFIRHEGYCAKCGRMLTDPTSIEQGYGPHCIKLVRKRIETQVLNSIKYEGYKRDNRAFNY